VPSKQAAPRAQSVTDSAETNFEKGETAMADEKKNPEAPQEIEPLSDESLEDVAGGEMCSILLCSTKAATTAP
jgi:hypothetical protein